MTAPHADDTAAPRRVPPLPTGFRVRIGADVRVLDGGGAMVGGAPTRLLRLTPRAAALLRSGELTVVDATTAALARRLLDGAIAHPSLSPADVPADEITVVIPLHDNQHGLDRLLPTLVGVRVIVVDDGSPRPVQAPGAQVIRHAAPRGPAAARNAGLRAARPGIVAFLDSDTVPRAGWLDTLAAHFADPAVALAAPRIAGLRGRPAPGPVAGALQRYEAIRSSLDLGPRPGPVVPGTPVAYVPSAAMLVRTSAVTAADPGAGSTAGSGTGRDADSGADRGAGFDERMHVAEDVDLCWRLHAAGRRLRYEPGAVVEHEHRTTLRGWLGRKSFYGEGAAPLADRHPGAVAPMVLTAWSAAAGAGLLSGTRVGAAGAAVACAVAGRRLAGTLTGVRRPRREATRLLALGLGATMQQLALGVCRHYWPLTVAAVVVSPRARRIAAVVAVGEGLADWWLRDARTPGGPRLDPVRYTVLKRLDDAGYGWGLWRGAWRARSVRALLPRRG